LSIFLPILTEVYGYAVARRVLWYCIFAQIVMSASFLVVIFYPPSAVMTNNQSYVDALSTGSSSLILSRLGSSTPTYRTVYCNWGRLNRFTYWFVNWKPGLVVTAPAFPVTV